jgi:hypothetical protein
MATVTIQEAQAKLKDFIQQLMPGDEKQERGQGEFPMEFTLSFRGVTEPGAGVLLWQGIRAFIKLLSKNAAF